MIYVLIFLVNKFHLHFQFQIIVLQKLYISLAINKVLLTINKFNIS